MFIIKLSTGTALSLVYFLLSSYSSSIKVRAGNDSMEKMLKRIFIKFEHCKHALGEEGDILTEQTPWSQRHRRRDMPLGGDPFGEGRALDHSLV